MNPSSRLLALALAGLTGLAGQAARADVQASASHEALLASPDARLAANKRLVYDFWREVLEGGHLELADRYLAESYIQHNPNVPTGRAGFVAFFSQFAKPHDIAPRVSAPLVSITAEGDLVTLSFVARLPDPSVPGASYTTTAFDMFRVENGRIAEHWDAARKQGEAAAPRAEARPAAPAAPAMQAYAGHYLIAAPAASDQPALPAGTRIDVIAEGDHLLVGFGGPKVRASPPEAFEPGAADEFAQAGSEARVRFTRDAQGRVQQLQLTGGGLSFTATR
ncbi:nuclear transport factor 2 family protein [Roseateles saccharophilus]|uniref:Putative SnoaL-like aldol condensation-catalyzing enzyme n=1 Tax=Roseateles saccharophilus TaxID=304 RepID=A0A4R3UZF4_ROSSA|nr:nuclear transport factor 2 family protein [Roseateles saccharophilus]TCU96188.1 putative SnoaL-like aldol condensation-catalyzing enzyme [Roseateles saccharophilus]